MKVIFDLITSVIAFLSLVSPIAKEDVIAEPAQESVVQATVLATQEFSLENRYAVKSVNDIFADNILLTLVYLDEEIKKGQPINWDKVRQPGRASFSLKPGETFAFHDNLSGKYQNTVVQTTNAHFNASEGFKSDGFIVGDGVCHLASFINVLATQAGLEVFAPVRHDFASIPDVTREFGTSINSTGTTQNLFVTNTTSQVVTFIFDHSAESIKITVESV